MAAVISGSRSALVSRALRLETVTIVWNVAEAGLAIASGLAAGSVALTGFGFDSVIEVIAAGALYSRLRLELRGARADGERRALWIVAASFFVLTAYVVIEAALTLWSRHAPESSVLGVVVALLAVVVMPLLARAKMRVGTDLGSAALVADAKCTLACGSLSGAVLVGVGAHLAFGWWWADPVAALCMAPFLVREGREAVAKARGVVAPCGCHAACGSTDTRAAG
jgi:divalent metal cation (Fe/Co/Zn/Cd) transporter